MTLNKTSTSQENQDVCTSLTSEVFTLTKQLNELRKLDDDRALTKQSISITEAALKKAQEHCASVLE